MIMLNSNDKITNFTSDNFEDFYKYVSEGFEGADNYEDDEDDANGLYFLDDENELKDEDSKNNNEFTNDDDNNQEKITFHEICDELSEDDYLTEDEEI